MFSLYKPIITYDPWGGAIFLAQGHNLNKLGRGSLGDVIYQISKLYALWFQRRRFLKFSSWKSIFSLCDLDMQWSETIWTIFKEGYIRIIPTKFGQNPASSLRDHVLWSNCWQRTTHDARRTSNDHKSSGELKTRGPEGPEALTWSP